MVYSVYRILAGESPYAEMTCAETQRIRPRITDEPKSSPKAAGGRPPAPAGHEAGRRTGAGEVRGGAESDFAGRLANTTPRGAQQAAHGSDGRPQVSSPARGGAYGGTENGVEWAERDRRRRAIG